MITFEKDETGSISVTRGESWPTVIDKGHIDLVHVGKMVGWIMFDNGVPTEQISTVATELAHSGKPLGALEEMAFVNGARMALMAMEAE